MTTNIKKLILSLLIGMLITIAAQAQVVVKPGTWPTMCHNGPFVTQTKSIVIKETLPGDFASISCSGGYFLLAPSGYTFDYQVGTVTAYSSGDFPVGLVSYEVYFNWIRFDYVGNGVSTIDSIVIDGTRIKAATGASTSVNLTKYEPVGCLVAQNGNMAANALNHGTLTSVANPSPTITYVPEPYYCNDQNTNYTLTATPAGGTWSGAGITGSTFNGFGLTAGTKVATYTYFYAPGCSNSSLVGLIVKVPPTITLSSSDADNTICPGENITFTATASGSNRRYQFYKNGIPVTTLSATNTYSTTTLLAGDQITVTADNGTLTCQASSAAITTTVVANPNATVTIPTLPALVCSNNANSYPINTNPAGLGPLSGSGVSGSSFTPSAAAIGSQTITYQAAVSGCSFPATMSVSVVQAPTVILSSSDADNIVCEGGVVTFTASTNGSANRYLFLKNTNGIQGPNSTNTYSTTSLTTGDAIAVTVDNGSGTCPTTSSTIVTTVGKIPKANFSWKSTCGQNSVTFKDLSTVGGANTLTTWAWDYTNDGVIDLTQSAAAPDPVFAYPSINQYQARLRVTSDKGCFKDTVIRVYTLPGKTPTPADPYTINFESTNQGWAYDGTNATWGWGTAPAAFGTGTRKLWSTGQNAPDGKYKTAEQSYLYGPCLNLSQLDKPMVAIKLGSKITGVLAGAIMEVSSDEGLNWYKLGNIEEGLNWYNEIGIASTPFTRLANNDNNNPDAQGWTKDITIADNTIARNSLQPYAGASTLRFRLNFASVANVVAARNAGIAVDSFWVGNRTRNVLMEHFTNNEENNTFCTNEFNIKCSTSNDSVNFIQTQRQLDAVSLQYHTSPKESDVFNNLNSADPSSRVFYYGVSNTPNTFLNGVKKFELYGKASGGLDVTDIDARNLTPAKFNIDVSVYTNGNNVKVATRYRYQEDLPFSSDVVAHIAIVEENKISQSKNYKYVLRKMLPDAAGNYLSRVWNKNDQVEVTKEWDFTDGNFAEMGVVVFIQNYNTKEVYQAVYRKGAGTTGNVVSSVHESKHEQRNVYLYPNPAQNEFFVLIADEEKNDYKWVLFDALGREVKSGNETNTNQFRIDTSFLTNGMYSLHLLDKNGNKMQEKIIIAK